MTVPTIVAPEIRLQETRQHLVRYVQQVREEGSAEFQLKVDETKGWIHDPWWRYRFWSLTSAKELNHPAWWPIALLWWMAVGAFAGGCVLAAIGLRP